MISVTQMTKEFHVNYAVIKQYKKYHNRLRMSNFMKKSVEAHFVAGDFALRCITITLSWLADIVSQVHGSTFKSFTKLNTSPA